MTMSCLVISWASLCVCVVKTGEREKDGKSSMRPYVTRRKKAKIRMMLHECMGGRK